MSDGFYDSSKIRTFATGATRSGGDKPEYAGYLSPVVIMEFGKYMFKHQLQADGTLRSCRNWQKGIPLESYMQSMFRHFLDVWSHYEAFQDDPAQLDNEYFMESLMAVIFNAQGMAHEVLGGGICDK